MFYKALYCINNLLSCLLMFLYIRAYIVLSFLKIMPPCLSIKPTLHAKQENLYRLKISFTVKELVIFITFEYLASTTKQTLEMKKTAGRGLFLLAISCTVVKQCVVNFWIVLPKK